MENRNIIKLNFSSEFLEGSDPTQHDRAYQPLHANADQNDEIWLSDDLKTVIVETDLSAEDWLYRQEDGNYEDGSGFSQRYSVQRNISVDVVLNFTDEDQLEISGLETASKRPEDVYDAVADWAKVEGYTIGYDITDWELV